MQRICPSSRLLDQRRDRLMTISYPSRLLKWKSWPSLKSWFLSRERCNNNQVMNLIKSSYLCRTLGSMIKINIKPKRDREADMEATLYKELILIQLMNFSRRDMKGKRVGQTIRRAFQSVHLMIPKRTKRYLSQWKGFWNSNQIHQKTHSQLVVSSATLSTKKTCKASKGLYQRWVWGSRQKTYRRTLTMTTKMLPKLWLRILDKSSMEEKPFTTLQHHQLSMKSKSKISLQVPFIILIGV